MIARHLRAICNYVKQTSRYHRSVFSVENQRGRLIETRVQSLTNVAEVDAFGARFRQVLIALPPRPVVICGDFRSVRVFAPDVAERFSAMLVAANPRVERSAILLDAGQAMAGLQLERTVKQAGHNARRTFRATPELIAWLSEVLDADEKKRLHEFLHA
jgi:hypothetical protein